MEPIAVPVEWTRERIFVAAWRPLLSGGLERPPRGLESPCNNWLADDLDVNRSRIKKLVAKRAVKPAMRPM